MVSLLIDKIDFLSARQMRFVYGDVLRMMVDNCVDSEG